MKRSQAPGLAQLLGELYQQTWAIYLSLTQDGCGWCYFRDDYVERSRLDLAVFEALETQAQKWHGTKRYAMAEHVLTMDRVALSDDLDWVTGQLAEFNKQFNFHYKLMLCVEPGDKFRACFSKWPEKEVMSNVMCNGLHDAIKGAKLICIDPMYTVPRRPDVKSGCQNVNQLGEFLMSNTINVLDRDYIKGDSKASMDFQPTKHNDSAVVFTAEHGFLILDKRHMVATPVEHLSIWGTPADKALRYEFGYACGQCNCRIVDVATGAAWDRYADTMDAVLKRVLAERENSVQVQALRQEEARKREETAKRYGGTITGEASKPVIVEGNNPELVADALLGKDGFHQAKVNIIEEKVMRFKFSGPDGKTYTSETKTVIYED